MESEVGKLSLSKLGRKGKLIAAKLDPSQRSDIKEKTYIVKSVDSSIAILESPEDEIVLDALLFLSKYVDTQLKSLNFAQQCALLQKLLTLLNRNVCIIRLTLRILGILLTENNIMVEINQDMYDDKIIKICNLYVTQLDPQVTTFCLSILSKLADSIKIACLIFKVDLLNPILETIQITSNASLLEMTLELLLKLLNAPAAVGILPEMYNFDITILLMHLMDPEENIAHLSYDIVVKLTFYCLDVFQKMFREAKLIEKMLEVVMDPNDTEFHEKAFEIISNSMSSHETSDYFIESLEFLKFCQWVKQCSDSYLLQSVTIIEQLTKIPARRQILFDLSVEESIMYFFRCSDKAVLNKTCEAMSNMTTHKYCCERMLTPVILKELLNMLQRKDTEDPWNEVALGTIIDFSRRDAKAIDMIHRYGVHKVLLGYFKRGPATVSERCYLGVLEILYKLSVHPRYQIDVVHSREVNFFEKLLHLFKTSSPKISTLVCEILINFVNLGDFKQYFLATNGPQIFVGVLQTSNDTRLIRNVLVFIHSCTVYTELIKAFLQNNLVRVLKEYPQMNRAPLVPNILKQVYDFHLPVKFYETNELNIYDRFQAQFYAIKGPWRAHFPFLEILEALQISTISTIYVVDYTYELQRQGEELSLTVDGTAVTVPSEWTLPTTVSPNLPGEQGNTRMATDVFLPGYVYHMQRNIDCSLPLSEQARILAEYVDELLCGPEECNSEEVKQKIFKEHLNSLRNNLQSNVIPIGYLRMGFDLERALLFKAIADKCNILVTLVKGKTGFYWNEMPLINLDVKNDTMKMYVMDLLENVGTLLLVGSKAANRYCHIDLI